MSQPVVVAFTGLPGTGKSTMADLLATEIGAPSFAGDWLMGALRPHGVLTGLERATALALYWDLLERLVTRQLMLGQSAVTDALVTDAVAAAWRREADRFAARMLVVECVCSDEPLHRRRLEGRQRGIPGWHEVGWDHVERMRAEFPPLTVDRLVIDAVVPVADNLHRLREQLRPA